MDGQPPAKKPRTEAQIAAFERARAAREANLRSKWQAEQDAVPAATPAALPMEQDEPAAVSEPVVPAPPLAAAPVVVQEEVQDYLDFDPDSFKNELYDKINSALDEVKQLREHITGVASKQEELQSSWQKHGVRSNNLLNFI